MSNGSERTPERCAHAPDGPDWAGLREPSSWKERAEAAEAENEKLREQANQWEAFTASDGVTSIRRKSDPERERLAAMFTAEQVKSNEYRREYMKAKRERDALRAAQLNSMSVEWHTTWNVSGRGLRRQKRLVSPWTAVEGAPDGQQ